MRGMTPIQVFDALNGKSFSHLETKGGWKFGGTPLVVNFCADESLEPACIEVTPDGLVLHFNSNGMSGMNGESVWFTDIVVVG
jgi:hypothetical protein